MRINLVERTSRRPRIFISYVPEDGEFVGWLSDSLRNLGHNVQLDRKDIAAGTPTLSAIHQAMDDSQVMLLVITPSSIKSRLLNGEWTYFYCECEKRLIPLLLRSLEPPDTLNFMLASLQHIDFSRKDHDAALVVLHRALQTTYDEMKDEVIPASNDHVPQNYLLQDHWSPDAQLSVIGAGVAHIHLDFPVEMFLDWLRNAQSIIRISNTWTALVDNYHILREAVRRGVAIHVLLLDPSTAIARQRSLDLHLGEQDYPLDEEEVPKNIRASIRHLATLYPELEGLPGQLELRLHSLLPSFPTYICDNKSLVGFFAHSSKMTDFPMLEIHMDSPFGIQINAEFDRMWHSALPVDLTPQFSTRILAANQKLMEPLSARELEILRFISAGLSNQEIAVKLVVTMATVKKHINNLYSKLQVNSRTRALLRAQELELV